MQTELEPMLAGGAADRPDIEAIRSGASVGIGARMVAVGGVAVFSLIRLSESSWKPCSIEPRRSACQWQESLN